MALTKGFKETVKARADREPAFRAALFQEAIELLLNDEVETAKAVMRDYINATIGFDKLAKKTGTSAPSLMRMFSDKGNPTANKLFPIIRKLKTETGLKIALQVEG